MEVAVRVKNALTQTVFRRFVELALPLSVDVVRSFGVHIDWGMPHSSVISHGRVGSSFFQLIQIALIVSLYALVSACCELFPLLEQYHF